MLKAYFGEDTPNGQTTIVVRRDGVQLLHVTVDEAMKLVNDRTVSEDVRTLLAGIIG